MSRLILLGILIGSGIGFTGCASDQPATDNPSTYAERGAETTSSTEQSLSIRTDSVFLKSLFEKAKPLIDSLPDSAIALYNQILQISKLTRYYSYTAAAYGNLAYCFNQKGDFQKWESYLKLGLAHLQFAINQPLTQTNPKLMKRLYEKLIRFSHQLGVPAEATYYYQIAKPLYQLNDPEQLKAYINIVPTVGASYIEKGQYDSAMTLYFRLLPFLQPASTDNYNTLFFVYTGIAASSGRLKKLKKARQYYDSAESIARQFDDSYLLMLSSSNLATFFLEEATFDSAKKYALDGLNRSNHLDSKLDPDRFGQFQNTYTLSAVLMQDGKPAEALPYSQSLLEAAIAQHSISKMIKGYYILGSNYLRLNRYQEAVAYLSKGLEQARAARHNEYISMISGQLGVAYAGLGDYEKAYIHKSNYITLKDSFRSKENATRFDELNAQYQVLQKDKVLADKQLSIERQQKLNYIWAGSTVLLTLLLVGFIWRRRQKLTIEKLKASLAGEEKERERIAQELHDGIVSKLSVIKTQFSALSPGSPVHELAYKDVVSQLDQSIREIRNTSRNLLPDPLRYADLEQILQGYCERIKVTSSLEITLQILDALPPFSDEFKLNIYRIIQELIQNILKHADATTVLIQFSIDEGILELTLEDNGSPGNWDKQVSEVGKGSGLQNLHNRIRLLHGRMEVEYHQGTSVYLYFPVKPHLAKG